MSQTYRTEIERLLKRASEEHGVPVEHIVNTGRRSRGGASPARHWFFYEAIASGASGGQIQRLFRRLGGSVDHTTIIYACRKVAKGRGLPYRSLDEVRGGRYTPKGHEDVDSG